MAGDLNGALGGRIRACAINDRQSDSACNNLKLRIRAFYISPKIKSKVIRPYNRF